MKVEARDVERILRDVLTAHSAEAIVLHVELTGDRWDITIKARPERVVRFDVADGPPAAIRAALTRWVTADD